MTESRALTPAARRYALVILAIVYMFNFIDRQIMAILLPAIREEFGVSDAWLGFLAGTAFAMFYIVLGIPVARYADRHNRRNLIALAVALWSGMTALCGVAASFWQLALARIGVGVGEAGCSPPAHSMIADMYPPELRMVFVTRFPPMTALTRASMPWRLDSSPRNETFTRPADAVFSYTPANSK